MQGAEARVERVVHSAAFGFIKIDGLPAERAARKAPDAQQRPLVTT